MDGSGGQVSALNTSNDVIVHGGSNNGATPQTAQSQGDNLASHGSPDQVARSSDQIPRSEFTQKDVDKMQEGVRRPDELVPATSDTNKLANSLRSEVQQRMDDTREEALIADKKGNFRTATACDSSTCVVPVIRDPALVLHRHVAEQPLTGEPGDRAEARRVTRLREMPGPGDHQPILNLHVPNYFVTPTGKMRVLEFNEYRGVRGFFVRNVAPNGSFLGGPSVWNPRQVQ